jgi:hypothetical protein
MIIANKAKPTPTLFTMLSFSLNNVSPTNDPNKIIPISFIENTSDGLSDNEPSALM